MIDLESELLKEHSRAQAQKIADHIGNHPPRFEELIHFILYGKAPIPQRAAWAMSVCVDTHPTLFEPHLKAVIEHLNQPKLHDAVKRNTLRLLQNVDIPEELMGITAHLCFEYLASSAEPIAIKVFAMTVLHHISLKEPDLQNELKIIINTQLPYASAGFKSRAKKILNSLEVRNHSS